MLDILNLVLILIIFVVMIINFSLTINLRSQVRSQINSVSSNIDFSIDDARETMKREQKKINSDVTKSIETSREALEKAQVCEKQNNILSTNISKSMDISRRALDKAEAVAKENTGLSASVNQVLQKTNDLERENMKQAMNLSFVNDTAYKALNRKVSMMDLAEFDSVNTEVKDIYKNYFVNNVIPRVLQPINQQVTPEVIQGLDQIGQSMANMDDGQLYAFLDSTSSWDQ